MDTDDRIQIHPWLSRSLKDRLDTYRREHGLSITSAVIVLLTSALDTAEDRQRFMEARLGRDDENE
jgi:hypothetical protein